jgi:type VI secretion system protein ImpC
VPGADPRQAEAVAQLDLTAAEVMRAVLHNPAFQALESAWRGLYFLVRRIETGPDLKLYLLDIPKTEMAARLERSRDDLRQSDFYRVAVQEASGTPGAEPWSLFAADYSFDAGEQDLEMLARLGLIALQAGAPLIAGASPALLAKRAGSGWPMLRKLPYANSIGLAMPRFLLRLPYGKNTSPAEQFAFEEMPEHDHEAYLWGNAAFVCACLQAESVHQIDGLPLHVYREDGESKVKPCAEVLMTEEQAEALLDNGIMPLVSYKDRDTARILRFQSIADPPAQLAGRWG